MNIYIYIVIVLIIIVLYYDYEYTKKMSYLKSYKPPIIYLDKPTPVEIKPKQPVVDNESDNESDSMEYIEPHYLKNNYNVEYSSAVLSPLNLSVCPMYSLTTPDAPIKLG